MGPSRGVLAPVQNQTTLVPEDVSVLRAVNFGGGKVDLLSLIEVARIGLALLFLLLSPGLTSLYEAIRIAAAIVWAIDAFTFGPLVTRLMTGTVHSAWISHECLRR